MKKVETANCDSSIWCNNAVMTVCHWTLVTNYVDDAGNSMNILNIGMGGYKYTVKFWETFY